MTEKIKILYCTLEEYKEFAKEMGYIEPGENYETKMELIGSCAIMKEVRK